MDDARRMVGILDRLRATFGAPNIRKEDPFSVLVWTVLSQNTNDRNTEAAFNRLAGKFKTFEQLARADLRELRELIRPAGLQLVKSRYLKKLAETVFRDHSCDLDGILRKPTWEARRELLSLPGVGYKTADCLLLFAGGRDVLPVDTHIFRIAKRLGFAGPADDHEAVKRKLEAVIPEGSRGEAHLLLIEHGRRYCRAREPLCAGCPIRGLCPSPIS